MTKTELNRAERAWELLLGMLRTAFRTVSTENPKDIFLAGFSAGEKHGQRAMLEKIWQKWNEPQTETAFTDFLAGLKAEVKR